ncbi:SLATT domain-containing protein [Microbacterium sp. NPDC091382]|uniref:SLATT domain-containing protein n=1 Tax=Microbacterium sp. NPDC091382 TaxID=3364210 RepID=UPI00382CF62E
MREAFARVAYSHKTQEKEAERKGSQATQIRVWNVAVFGTAAITTVVAPLLESVIAAWVAAIATIIGFVFTALQLSFDPADEAASHRLAAKSYLTVRNDYMRFIADVSAASSVTTRARARRESLAEQVRLLDSLAPQTSPQAYAAARHALRTNEELTFDEAELSQLLPGQRPPIT